MVKKLRYLDEPSSRTGPTDDTSVQLGTHQTHWGHYNPTEGARVQLGTLWSN